MKHVWVVGEGGIGRTVHQKLKTLQYQVTTLSRKDGVNLFDSDAIHQILSASNTLPDIVINTCGILHDKTHMPEKSLQELTEDWLEYSIAVNVGITANLAKVLTPYLSSSYSVQFCAFSARVSSISDNHKGGWYSYRMSKAMLNMLIKNIAIEWRLKSPQSVIFGYHPGTVDTQLSKPFRKYIPEQQLFSPENAVDYFTDVLFDKSLDKNGKLIDWQGLEIMP